MNKEVKFSVRIHQADYSYQSLRRIWIEADRLGYYSATLYDLLNAPALECWTTLSALAAETSRIRLTPLVLANTYRHPAVFAKMASTLDRHQQRQAGGGNWRRRRQGRSSGFWPQFPFHVREG